MTHTGTVRLETSRLILRPMTMDDAPAMFKNWACDPAVTTFMSWDAHANIDVTKGVLADWTGKYSDPAYYHWAIEPKEVGEIIGTLGVMNVHEDDYYCDVGYCIGKAWWGKGIMTEALAAAIAHLFNAVGMNRIEARHDVLNPASGRVMVKSGMRREGVQRQARYHHKRGFYDISIYGILKEDHYGA